MRLKQHLARYLWLKLETWEIADTGEVETEIDGRHAKEAPIRVHDEVIVGKGKGAGAAKGMSCKEGDSGEGVVKECCQELVKDMLTISL